MIDTVDAVEAVELLLLNKLTTIKTRIIIYKIKNYSIGVSIFHSSSARVVQPL
jgi:hypothetical protein